MQIEVGGKKVYEEKGKSVGRSGWYIVSVWL